MSDGRAPWWDDPDAGKGGDSVVVRHAPDDRNYHLPTPDLVSRMGGSPVGKFAVVPGSYSAADGRSKGFDANVAGPVHVDPGAPDGGVIFDPATVAGREIDAAVEQSYYPHQVYYRLGHKPQQNGHAYEPVVDTRVNPHVGAGTYLAPKATGDGRQMNPNIVPPLSRENPMAPVPQLPSLPSLVPQAVPGPNPAALPPVQTPQLVTQFSFPGQMPAPIVPPMDSGMIQMMQQMMGAMAGMQQRMNQMEQQRIVPPLPPTTGVSSNPMPVSRPISTMPVEAGGQPAADYGERARPIRRQRQPEGQEEEMQRNPNSMVGNRQKVADWQEEGAEGSSYGVIAGFETLGIPYVNGPLAQKPKKRVIFEFPNGKMSASYHDVINEKTVIVLIYDTRYEDGHQFVPPNFGDKVVGLAVPSMKLNTQVCSMDLTASFGCFDLIILVKPDTQERPDTDEE